MMIRGEGFVGSFLIRFFINKTKNHLLNFNKLTYAGNLESLKGISKNFSHKFVQIVKLISL